MQHVGRHLRADCEHKALEAGQLRWQHCREANAVRLLHQRNWLRPTDQHLVQQVMDLGNERVQAFKETRMVVARRKLRSPRLGADKGRQVAG
ncbi:hypothetical protein D3C71_2044060 [compost metagenome]